jgi:hypothetical protein
MVYLGELMELPDVDVLVGMTEEKGLEFAKAIGYRFRCMRLTVNGKSTPLMGTADMRGDRINYEQVDGIITRVWIG